MTSNTGNSSSRTHHNVENNDGTKKSLRWAKMNTQYSIIHINDMSKEEINQSWYNTNDYNEFMADCRSTIDVMKHVKKGSNAEMLMKNFVCGRGLEAKIYKKIGTRKSNRKETAKRIVLKEQANQRYWGIPSPEYIAELYIDVCASGKKYAYLKGLQDAFEAQSCHNEEVVALKKTSSSNSFASSDKSGLQAIQRDDSTAHCVISPMA